jgi:hypothetical protein
MYPLYPCWRPTEFPSCLKVDHDIYVYIYIYYMCICVSSSLRMSQCLVGDDVVIPSYSHFYNDWLFFSHQKKLEIQFRICWILFSAFPYEMHKYTFFYTQKKINHYENESKARLWLESCYGYGYGYGYERAYFTHKDLCSNQWPQYYPCGLRVESSVPRRSTQYMKVNFDHPNKYSVAITITDRDQFVYRSGGHCQNLVA